ncbi:glucosaminidase domain-containing protein [Sulfurimonas sp. CVO]|uniref:glucosaminidase domain-containing protein n=1 Tax=Sulfurimonas sp. CVO TaxID=2283483 RepID=UPI00135C6D49|nr:glucosaminidase domain-containing protein [Sulfurimonas sp. CVO]
MKFLYENTLLIFLVILLLFFLSTFFSQSKIEEVEKIEQIEKIKQIEKAEKIKKEKKKSANKAASVEQKKKQFNTLIIPAINSVHNELQTQYEEIAQNLENDEYKEKISELKEYYGVESDEELLMALKPHPVSISIAQAAMESAWAKSRFFVEANNLYGIWSFNKNEPRIAAVQQRGSRTIWLKKYSDIKDSIRDYYKTLARSYAYKDFRELKMQTDDPYILIEKLDNYSEIGEKYAENLSEIIRYNKFYLYDR